MHYLRKYRVIRLHHLYSHHSTRFRFLVYLFSTRNDSSFILTPTDRSESRSTVVFHAKRVFIRFDQRPVPILLFTYNINGRSFNNVLNLRAPNVRFKPLNSYWIFLLLLLLSLLLLLLIVIVKGNLNFFGHPIKISGSHGVQSNTNP